MISWRKNDYFNISRHKNILANGLFLLSYSLGCLNFQNLYSIHLKVRVLVYYLLKYWLSPVVMKESPHLGGKMTPFLVRICEPKIFTVYEREYTRWPVINGEYVMNVLDCELWRDWVHKRSPRALYPLTTRECDKSKDFVCKYYLFLRQKQQIKGTDSRIVSSN